MQGTTQFFAYGDLIEAQWRTAARLLTSPMLAAFALASVPVVVALVWTRVRDSETNDDLWLDLVTGILGILSFSYLFLPLLQRPAFETAMLVFPALLLVFVIWTVRPSAGRLDCQRESQGRWWQQRR